MATVHFYEKPGCLNNTRQKQLLTEAGHVLIVYDLLQQPWAQNPEKLRSFFGDMPVSDWFNPSAPDIKNGSVVPENLSEAEAIERMVGNPLLIRRPLLEVNGHRHAGFQDTQISTSIQTPVNRDMETCPQANALRRCSP